MGKLVFSCHEDQEIICFLEDVSIFLPTTAEFLKKYLGIRRMGWGLGPGVRGKREKTGAEEKKKKERFLKISNEAQISLFNELALKLSFSNF